MQKIPTLFVRDESKPGHPVMDEWKPECLWVRDGEGVPTVKIDGTNVKVEHGQLFKRQKPKERDYDEASYVPCDRANPADRWAWEAFDEAPPSDGIYELVGPKIQGNPHGHNVHGLVPVVPFGATLRLPVDIERTYDALKRFLTANTIEGLVFHHQDGRMAKIKRRDFGLKWPDTDRAPRGR